MSTLAIDIGGTKVALGLVQNGELIERAQLATPETTCVQEFASQILLQCPSWIHQVTQIGISTTGWVKPEGITSINPDTLAFPQPFPLHQEIEAQTDKPVAILNDAQAAAWYEYRSLKTPVNNMAYITVSTGVGGGLVLNGQLYKGVSISLDISAIPVLISMVLSVVVGNVVVLKALPPERQLTELLVKLFTRQSQILSCLNSPVTMRKQWTSSKRVRMQLLSCVAI